MAVSVPQRHDERVLLLDMIERSLRLGAWPELACGAIPVEVLETMVDASAEAYITRITVTGDAARIDLVLDHGLPGLAKLPVFEVEWLGLAEEQIVPVRLDRWASAE
jgi:hypothetical protein